MNPLLEKLSETVKISEELEKEISEKLIYKSLKKNETILRPGQTCNYLYFMKKGLIRNYYILDGKEISSVFTAEGDFVISILSFYLRQASTEFIEAIEDCELLGFHYQDLQGLYLKYHEFALLGKNFTEHYLCLSEERILAMRMRTAKDRYQFLMNKKGNLLNRVPLKDLASYLGVSPETVSRMRALVR